MKYYKLIPTIDNFPLGMHPNVPSGINYEAKSYDIGSMTCKIKTLRGEVIVSGTEITEQEYLEN